MSFLFLNGRTLKGLRITLRLLGDTFPYNPLYITVNLNFTTDIIEIMRFFKLTKNALIVIIEIEFFGT